MTMEAASVFHGRFWGLQGRRDPEKSDIQIHICIDMCKHIYIYIHIIYIYICIVYIYM